MAFYFIAFFKTVKLFELCLNYGVIFLAELVNESKLWETNLGVNAQVNLFHGVWELISLIWGNNDSFANI